MIKENILNFGNALVILKHMGFCKTINGIKSSGFTDSSLGTRFAMMIVEENKKKEGINKQLLIDLCECYLLLNDKFSSELRSICGPCLFYVASNKSEREEVKTEVEMSLLALAKLEGSKENCSYLDVIDEIIKYHQKHHNLTRLAYQSAWSFLVGYLYSKDYLKVEIMYKMHFARESTSELEELLKRNNLVKKEKSLEEMKEVRIIGNWVKILIEVAYHGCNMSRKIFVGLFSLIARLYKATKGFERKISDDCINLFCEVIKLNENPLPVLVRSGATGCVLEEMSQSTLHDNALMDCLQFLHSQSEIITEGIFEDFDETEWNFKRELFDILEEDGYEDLITSSCCANLFLINEYWFELIPGTEGCLMNL
ncbi:uncharacterized protein MONOS_3893 [Monocercomonoides exilis]|uniref:uncharacterized protein n=1 Tax=Monocercomonoides exilis TaxID=2049356 RepID=UPI00355A11A9|nr:hypothetical protein MONOS_3893 [Monocercomonoides exilis]|eukprot:MONOS_3893.1-p1 / transcript=MONOS_3893.1 / gene=MONOS_3893 / organism=Monocercomonoides_exilis_PA203 / gene_product=unspecified product / transcript_product=unspecified product / location=Mono_scaffold00096:63859-65029(+) / protein_length=369 / sequence_SO=supercontig / SO=protein_coding / is_pseudo=false